MLRRISGIALAAVLAIPIAFVLAPGASAAGVAVTADPAAIDLGELPTAVTATRTVTLTATTAVSFSAVALSGLTSDGYAITGDACTFTQVGAGASCQFTVTFNATSEGIFEQSVRVLYNGPGIGNEFDIPLSAVVAPSTSQTVADTISGPNPTPSYSQSIWGRFAGAQAFTATRSGVLTAVSALLTDNAYCAEGVQCMMGDLRVELRDDGPGAVLASATVPMSSVPGTLGPVTTVRFTTNPPRVVAGHRYLIALSAPGAQNNNFRWWASTTASNEPHYASTDYARTWQRVTNTTETLQAKATIAEFAADTAAPVITVDNRPDSPTTNRSATFTFQGADDRTSVARISYQCRIDQADWAPCTSPATYDVLDLGAHTFDVRATDLAGNAADAAASWTVYDVPGAATNVSAAAGDRSAVVSWDAAAGNGSPVTGYTITAAPGGRSASVDGDARTAAVPGLVNGTAYTFTVTATNAAGTGPASAPSAAVTPADVPDPPAQVSATAGDRSAVVSWDAAAGNGSPVTGYTIAATPGGRSMSVDADTHTTTITGLVNGTAYTFTLTATNAAGTSAASTPSTEVVPRDAIKPTVTVTGTPPALTTSGTGRFIFTATDDSDPVAALTYHCSLDGVAATACVSPRTYTGLTSGTHRFTVTALDTSGNQSTPMTYAWRVDNTAPTVALTAPTASYTLSSALAPAWSTKDTGAGVANVDVRWQRAAYNSGFTAWIYPTSWQKTTATTATMSAARGYTYCFAARARDKASNTSTWTTPRCTAAPLDDRSLIVSSGWTRASGSRYFAGTVTRTTRLGATLTRSKVVTHRIALVAARGPRFGTVGIYWNGTLVKKINLSAATTQPRTVLSVTTFTGIRSGTVSVRALTNGKTIEIDGLALSYR